MSKAFDMAHLLKSIPDEIANVWKSIAWDELERLALKSIKLRYHHWQGTLSRLQNSVNTLTCLLLVDCRMGIQALEMLSHLLRSCTSLQELSLEHNDLGVLDKSRRLGEFSKALSKSVSVSCFINNFLVEDTQSEQYRFDKSCLVLDSRRCDRLLVEVGGVFYIRKSF
jgi:hypothetical protein